MAMVCSSPLKKHNSTIPNWQELPTELTMEILRHLNATDLLAVAPRVCVKWREVCKDPSIWRSSSLDMYNILDTDSCKEKMCRMYYTFDMASYMESMCQYAVDRSCGSLNDVTLRGFGSVKLLLYIANRASQLKRLRLIDCHHIHKQGLARVAARLPNLEDLQIFNFTVPGNVFACFGQCCPKLKSLTYDLHKSHMPHNYCDYGVALQIAHTMPGLRHLNLCGNNVKTNGLRAILEKCIHIESLDLSFCIKLDLTGLLSLLCTERIKHLKLPNCSRKRSFSSLLRDIV